MNDAASAMAIWTAIRELAIGRSDELAPAFDTSADGAGTRSSTSRPNRRPRPWNTLTQNNASSAMMTGSASAVALAHAPARPACPGPVEYHHEGQRAINCRPRAPPPRRHPDGHRQGGGEKRGTQPWRLAQQHRHAQRGKADGGQGDGCLQAARRAVAASDRGAHVSLSAHPAHHPNVHSPHTQAPWLLPNTLPTTGPPAFYPNTLYGTATALPGLLLNPAAPAPLPLHPPFTDPQTTLAEILHLATGFGPPRQLTAPFPGTAAPAAGAGTAALHLGALSHTSQQQLAAAAAAAASAMLSSGLANMYASGSSAHLGPRLHSFATSGSAAAGAVHNASGGGGGVCSSQAAAPAAPSSCGRCAATASKRSMRHFEKTIRYASRQDRATKRPRVKGRFIKQEVTDSHVTATVGLSAGGCGDADATTGTTAMARPADTHDTTTACGGSVCSSSSSDGAEGEEEVETASCAALGQQQQQEQEQRAGVMAGALEQQGSRSLDAAAAAEGRSPDPGSVLDGCDSTGGRAGVAVSQQQQKQQQQQQQGHQQQQQGQGQVATAAAQQRGFKRSLSCGSIHSPGQELCPNALPLAAATRVSGNQQHAAGPHQPAAKAARTGEVQQRSSCSQAAAKLPISSFLRMGDSAFPGPLPSIARMPTADSALLQQHSCGGSTPAFHPSPQPPPCMPPTAAAAAAAPEVPSRLPDSPQHARQHHQLQCIDEEGEEVAQGLSEAGINQAVTVNVTVAVAVTGATAGGGGGGGGGGRRGVVRVDSTVGVLRTAPSHHQQPGHQQPAASCGSCGVDAPAAIPTHAPEEGCCSSADAGLCPGPDGHAQPGLA
ncbi:MAG: hypothetical protein WDW38_005901 [Sanguina aurantia]